MNHDSFPRVDEHIVEPETRQEMVRGEPMEALPANPPHAERHTDLDYVTRGHVAPGYVVAADLLTRAGPGSNFATDVCVRKVGIDPQTGGRYLEELAFEVVAEQSLQHITVRAEDLATRGVRRIIVVFVNQSEVAEWSQAERRFVPLPINGRLEDPTLMRPIPIRALLDAASADNAVAAALRAKDNPWLVRREQDVSANALARGREEGREEGREQAQSQALLLVLRGRGLHPSDAQRQVIQASTDSEQLERWLLMAGRVHSIDELLVADADR
ncbi:Uma2 family endonuclease [Enhygromyxa salina]|uniref:Uma2 family endonuclease n=1 Tax=Enhygromyxa salina TaxID=215803 RepID=UPI0011BAE00D|nr:Uma2 family endonuclease [Enhygromyxa salina]